MTPLFRNLLLSATLIAVPAGGFTLAEIFLSPAPAAASASAGATQGLGDLAPYTAIVSDTEQIAANGDLAAAERRITDLETLWDRNAPKLRAADRTAWSAIDGAADAAFAALRARHPDAAEVRTALTRLQAALAAPGRDRPAQPLKYVAGIAVTDATGRALPCEEMIGQLSAALGHKTPPAGVRDLQASALERCNADDDARADAFAAQALAQIQG